MKNWLGLLSLLTSLIAIQINAQNDDIEITENPFDYYDAALARVRQFLPNAEFNELESSSNFPLGCSAQEWTFSFVDKIAGEVGRVHTAEFDNAGDGGSPACKRVYDVKIQEIGDSDFGARFTSLDPREYMQNNFDFFRQKALKAIGDDFFMLKIQAWHRFSDDLYIQFDGMMNGQSKFIRINATTGSIDAISPR